MKTLLTLVAVAAFAGSVFAVDEKPAKPIPPFTPGSCCDKAVKAGKVCDHKCCIMSAKNRVLCLKCNKPPPPPEKP